jgi:hypothetical protein
MSHCPTPTKQRYETKREAKASPHGRLKHTESYKCVCGCWHTTSYSKRRYRRRLIPVD